MGEKWQKEGMLYSYKKNARELNKEGGVDPEAIWFDLIRPKPDEAHQVEEALNLSLPSYQEMEEIEASSRLYREEGSLFMTVVLIAKADSENPFLSPVTFLVANKYLVTVRYADPRSFRIVERKIERGVESFATGEAVLVGILEAIVDRLADILEKIGREVDEVSKDIFQTPTLKKGKSKRLDELLTTIGKKGDLTAKAKESLVSLGRLFIFLTHQIQGIKEKKALVVKVKTLQRDVSSLTDHCAFLLNKINFLLDATLGFINIEQNGIIKIFSVAAVIFLPPTVIASIYGMNFIDMPELHWAFGYPFALVLMVASALLPYFYFKQKGWL
ncbi:MAG: Magnesium transport protein CorA [Chlamydiae bacterium]|nr:Magnesium transport protein CorA [Chlamydiota bacterium]